MNVIIHFRNGKKKEIEYDVQEIGLEESNIDPNKIAMDLLDYHPDLNIEESEIDRNEIKKFELILE